MARKRLDRRLVELDLVSSRQQAQGFILAGRVQVDGVVETKAGCMVGPEQLIEIDEPEHYVSRGAYKLLKAVEDYAIDLEQKLGLDVGASTGGFTQVMLEAGARKVYSVDVGYGQFDYGLRIDPRVVLLERQNARYLDSSIIPEPIDFFSIDVSFISVKLILPTIAGLLAEAAEGVILIKPQFEAGRDQVGKGIITDPKIHRQVIADIVEFVQTLGWQPLHLGYSPIKGPKGNREFLLHVATADTSLENTLDIDQVVAQAHQEL